MTELEEIRVKLNGAQTDLEKLEANFHQMVELKDGLHSADTSLKTSASNLSSMSAAMERNTQAMKDCVSSLQSAASLLVKFEPLEITKKQDHFEQELGRMNQEIGKIASEMDELPQKIQETVQAAASRSEKTSGSIVFLTLLVLVSLGISAANLYMTHGQQMLQ